MPQAQPQTDEKQTDEKQQSRWQQALQEIQEIPTSFGQTWYLEADKNPKKRKATMTIPQITARSKVLVRTAGCTFKLGPNELCECFGWGSEISVVLGLRLLGY